RGRGIAIGAVSLEPFDQRVLAIGAVERRLRCRGGVDARRGQALYGFELLGGEVGRSACVRRLHELAERVAEQGGAACGGRGGGGQLGGRTRRARGQRE